jgi:hypothetical protein
VREKFVLNLHNAHNFKNLFFAEKTETESMMYPFSFDQSSVTDKKSAEDSYSAGLHKKFAERLENSSVQRENILFVLDEARMLLGQSRNESNFVIVRRAMTHFSREHPRYPLFVMTDTVARVSNFGPVKERDPSLRATMMPKGIFPPFYLLVNVDI